MDTISWLKPSSHRQVSFPEYSYLNSHFHTYIWHITYWNVVKYHIYPADGNASVDDIDLKYMGIYSVAGILYFKIPLTAGQIK